MIIIWYFVGHKMIFVILYPAIYFKTSHIPTVKTYVCRSREDDFILHPASNFLCIPHPASILSPIPRPPNLCWTLNFWNHIILILLLKTFYVNFPQVKHAFLCVSSDEAWSYFLLKSSKSFEVHLMVQFKSQGPCLVFLHGNLWCHCIVRDLCVVFRKLSLVGTLDIRLDC